MAKTMNCRCGQVLDIEGFAPGASVRCPGCQNVLAVPAAPPMALAAAVEDSNQDLPASTGPAPKRKLTPAEEQKLAERRAAQRLQRTLMRIMLWPALLFGLAALGIAVLGVLGEFGKGLLRPAEKVIKIETDASGFEHLYTLDPAPNAPPHQYIEVQPDIIPCDAIKHDADDNPVYLVNGQPVRSAGGNRSVVTLYEKGDQTREATVERHGLWFYEVDPATGKIKGKLDKLPLYAQERGEEANYVPVQVHEVTADRIVFYKRGSDTTVDVVYYHMEGPMQTDKLGKFKEPEVDFFTPFRQRLWIFIVAGLVIGLMLLGAAGFFVHQCYFSKAARAA